MIYKNLSAYLVIVLAVIAAVVAVGLIAGLAMWPVIILYWMVLTMKNVLDYLAMKENGKDGDDEEDD
jgi:hypothetical protein